MQVSILSTLDLSFNRLTEVKRYGLASVGRLDVSYNMVERIADDAITGLHHSLAELDVGYNRLTHLGPSVLHHARSLLVLDLRHNFLGPKFGISSSPSSSADPGDLTPFVAPASGNLFQASPCARIVKYMWFLTEYID